MGDESLDKTEMALLKRVSRSAQISSVLLGHNIKRSQGWIDKYMEGLRRKGMVKYARPGIPKSWEVVNKGRAALGLAEVQKPGKGGRRDGRGGGRGGRDGDRGRGGRDGDRDKRGGRDNRDNRRGDKGGDKRNNRGENQEQRQKDRQKLINGLFLFFKDHAQHSFTAAEISKEFAQLQNTDFTVSHLNSLLYELLRYGDVQKLYDNTEIGLLWYLDDRHLILDEESPAATSGAEAGLGRDSS